MNKASEVHDSLEDELDAIRLSIYIVQVQVLPNAERSRYSIRT